MVDVIFPSGGVQENIVDIHRDKVQVGKRMLQLTLKRTRLITRPNGKTVHSQRSNRGPGLKAVNF